MCAFLNVIKKSINNLTVSPNHKRKKKKSIGSNFLQKDTILSSAFINGNAFMYDSPI